MKFLSAAVLALAAVCSATPARADDVATALYAQHKQSIYRIDVLAQGSEKKASLGTGFVIGRPNVLASNFHVVADAVHDPQRYRLEWESVTGERGPLKVIEVDVVHDLALLEAEKPLGEPHVTGTLPPKGSALYALGHPLALALTIVPGTANGLLEKSLYDKIHFSGNINPGMSGGPTLDAQGRVVGVNVATAGDAVGFLVPAHYLDVLIERVSERQFAASRDLEQSIGEQLLANQDQMMQAFFAGEWPSQTLGKFAVPGEISSRMDCWGENDPATPKRPLIQLSSNCNGQDDIYLSSRQRAGFISYQYFWMETDTLSPRAFYRWYENQHNSQFMSDANDTDVGNFKCAVHFVRAGGQNFKANVCARPYKRYPRLHDFMVLMAMTGHEQKGMMFTLDLSSVTLDNGMALLKRFLERFEWQD